MKHYLTALVLVGGLAAAQANAGCDYPSKPGKIPDGMSATKEEMLAAKKLVVKYTEDMQTYLACLDTETSEKIAAMPNATEKEKTEYQQKQDQKHNAAVIEMTEVTDGFNEQLRAYKAKNPPKTS
jgi:hypothetical protein